MERRRDLLRDPSLCREERFRPYDELATMQPGLNWPASAFLRPGGQKRCRHASANGNCDCRRCGAVAGLVGCDGGEHVLRAAYFLRVPRELPRRARRCADKRSVDVE